MIASGILMVKTCSMWIANGSHFGRV